MSSEKSVSSQTGEERIVWYSINFVQLELEAGLAYPPVETPHSQAQRHVRRSPQPSGTMSVIHWVKPTYPLHLRDRTFQSRSWRQPHWSRGYLPGSGRHCQAPSWAGWFHRLALRTACLELWMVVCYKKKKKIQLRDKCQHIPYIFYLLSQGICYLWSNFDHM